MGLSIFKKKYQFTLDEILTAVEERIKRAIRAVFFNRKKEIEFIYFHVACLVSVIDAFDASQLLKLKVGSRTTKMSITMQEFILTNGQPDSHFSLC
jgi:hypothetical protein